MKNRSELREIAMKVLYQIDILEDAKQPVDVNELIKEQLEIENEFVNTLIDGVISNKKKIKKLANDHLNGWTIDRLSKVDKAILEIGIYILSTVLAIRTFNLYKFDGVSWGYFAN